jgi:hypothetical protein
MRIFRSDLTVYPKPEGDFVHSQTFLECVLLLDQVRESGRRADEQLARNLFAAALLAERSLQQKTEQGAKPLECSLHGGLDEVALL